MRTLTARISRYALAVVPVALLTGLLTGPATAQNITGNQVRRAINKGIAYVKGQQDRTGPWPGFGRYEGGPTALALVALQNAGVSSDDPAIRRGLHALRGVRNRYTYVVALKAMAMAMAEPEVFRDDIQAAADFLIEAQLSNGAWTYGISRAGSGDHSNTQFALLGLHAASQAGIKIPSGIWRAAEEHWSKTQRSNGGWGYAGSGKSNPTPSMTAAGVASLFIVGNSYQVRRERGYTKDGRAPNCGRYVQHAAIAAGMNWLARRMDLDEAPRQKIRYTYYLYAVERVGMLSGLSRIGEHDWYRLGAEQLVRSQQGDGSWMGNLIDTSFALMFLGKGHRSVLVNKLRWSRSNNWQEDRNDIRHLTAWMGSKLGEPVTWQVVDLDDPIERWLEAPILYFNGHTFPRFKPEVVAKLRRFVQLGGTILAEACCSREAFIKGMRAFAAEHFGEWPLRPIESSHPIYNAMYELRPSDFKVEGIDMGCRTSIVFCPRDVSCLWEQGDVPTLSEQAFRLGANIAAYATGRGALRDRLDVVTVPDERDPTAAVRQGGLQLGQLVHAGGWRPAPYAMPNLAIALNEQANVDVVTRAEAIRLTDPELFEHPIVYMAGSYEFELSAEEKVALKTFLERGGFVFADACCGRKPFDRAFRKLMAELFGPEALKPLSPKHPILAGQIGYDISKVTYQPVVQRERPDLDTPVLEGVELSGRTAVVYSPYDIGCALEGNDCPYCHGYIEADAKRIAVNIILYGLSY